MLLQLLHSKWHALSANVAASRIKHQAVIMSPVAIAERLQAASGADIAGNWTSGNTTMLVPTEEEAGMSSTALLLVSFVATVIPLACAALAILALRRCWHKIRRGGPSGYRRGDLTRDESAIQSTTAVGDTVPSTDDVCSDLATVTTSDGNMGPMSCQSQCGVGEVTIRAPLLQNQHVDNTSSIGHPSVPNHHNSSTTTRQGANGSLITMTLDNNHLIVETEEIIVVEQTPTAPIAEGEGDTDQGLGTPASQAKKRQSLTPSVVSEKTPIRNSVTHSTPKFGFNTGLSQSDLSLTSIGGSGDNPSYQYGNQTEYLGGYFGYPLELGYSTSKYTNSRTPIPMATTAWPSYRAVNMLQTVSVDEQPSSNADENDDAIEEANCSHENPAYLPSSDSDQTVAN